MNIRHSIFLRFLVSALLIIATAGITVHEHACAMMGRSISLVAKDDCCAPLRSSSGDADSISRVPCCQDEIRTIALDSQFDLLSAGVPTAVHSLYVIAGAPSPLYSAHPTLPLLFGDISPHPLRSSPECINNLRS
ncbi:MAG: hypothetical protein WBQ23_04220 [Bacteroidota bacterium]